MEDHEEDFADLLGRYRVRAGLKQQELATKIGVHRNTIVNWENRTKPPEFRSKVLQLADELSLSKAERKAFIQAAGFSLEWWPTEVWTVPQQRDMFFTGRDDVFQSLRELLVPGSTTALTQAISGLGGIGKTHTAVEYAYRFHKDYEAVLWLQADSWGTLTSECIKLATQLGLPERKEADQAVAEVQLWLRKHRRWLLILDNVEHPQEILPKFVPTDHQGCVLVTTRVHSVEPLAQTRVLLTMTEQEGVIFLLRRTTRIAAKAGLEKASPEQYDEARQIWQLLDGLPLALDQAGAYILETGCSFFAYQDQYARRRTELLPRRGKRFSGHEASVATTFSLAFERIKALNLVAADVLRTCSLLYSEAIPEEIFHEGAELLGLLLVENRSLDEALGVLQDYSLVLRNREERLLSIHRLVQVVLQDEMTEAERQHRAGQVILVVNTTLPQINPSEPSTWPQTERLLLQALTAAQTIELYEIIGEEAGWLLYKTASYLYARARYTEAEPLYRQALQIFERYLGPEHPNVVQPLNGLAGLYRRQARYTEAEPLFQRAISLQEQRLGPEHPEVVMPLNNLALLYREQGKYAEAESLFQRALHIREQHLGPEHSLVAWPLNNLASLYWEQGKYAEAESLYQRALKIREQHLGPEHLLVAHVLSNLAGLYRDQGKYTEVESLYQRVLKIREQHLGSEHPLIAYPLNGLAILYHKQGKYTEAESLFQRALHIWEQQSGPEHPQKAYTLNSLANHYRDQGKYANAESLYQRALHIYELTQGAWHHYTAEVISDLAQLREVQGNGEEARIWYNRALAICEQALGAHHPATIETRSRLINLLYVMGQYEQAAQLEAMQSGQGMTEEGQKTHSEE